MQINQEIYFSIIIPVYNVENYLHRCLDSILNQDFNLPFEIIAINDASTDSSLQILLNYQNQYDNFKVISNFLNSKLSATRLKGFQIARGEYILNVDSDDWLLPGALTGIYSWLKAYETDVLIFNYKREDNNGNSRSVHNIDKVQLTLDKKLVAEHFLGACWNKVVKRTLLCDLIYGKVSINSQEDLIYSFEVLMKADFFLTVPDFYYTYFNNEASITKVTKSLDYLALQVDVLIEIKRIFQKYNTEPNLQYMVYGYIQKFIYDLFTKMHFWKETIDSVFLASLIKKISTNELLDSVSISKLNKAVNSKWFCLLQEKKYWGSKMAAYILLNGFSRKSK